MVSFWSSRLGGFRLSVLLAAALAASAHGGGWSSEGRALTPREGVGMAYDRVRDRVVMFGGMTDTRNLTNETWEYDGAEWTLGPPAPSDVTPRYLVGMGFHESMAAVVMTGGSWSTGSNGTWSYDGSGWSRLTGGLPGYVSMTWEGDIGRLVATTARSGSRTPGETFVLDISVWLKKANNPAYGQAPFTICWDSASGDTLAFVWRRQTGSQLWRFADSNTWHQIPAPLGGWPRAPSDHGMVDLGSGRVMIFGGQGPGVASDRTLIWDGTRMTVLPQTVAPHPRSRMGLLATPSGALLFGGGYSGSSLGDTWTFNGASWQEISDGPAPRSSAAAVWDESAGRLLMFGGHRTLKSGPNGPGETLADTWEHDGQQFLPGPAPPAGLVPREGHAMVWDSARSVAVLFGGRDETETPLDDTWFYDGTAWTPGPSAPAGLAARGGHAMAYDDGRDVTVLLGGHDQQGVRKDVWEFDGSAWSPGVVAPGQLYARTEAGAAFDRRRATTVLFGGEVGSQKLGDVWEYDGAGWTPGSPPPSDLLPRSRHAMVWDPFREVVSIHGGLAVSVFDEFEAPDTWHYDGAAWSIDRAPFDLELSRRDAALVATNDGLVLIGGNNGWADLDGLLRLRPNGAPLYVAGEGFAPARSNQVRTFDRYGARQSDFPAYAAGAWGVDVGTGQVRAQIQSDILTGPGPGPIYGPQVRAFELAGVPVATINFFAYGTLRYGVAVDGAEVDGSNYEEILTGPGPGVVFGPHIRGFDPGAGPLQPIAGLNFFAYGTLRYGANLGSGDLDLDTWEDILTGGGAGASFGPHVRGFEYDDRRVAPLPGLSFFAFQTPAWGARVAGGSMDPEPAAEIGTAPGPGPGPSFPGRYRVFDYADNAVAQLPGADIIAHPQTEYGATVELGDLDADGLADLTGGPGPGPAAAPTVRTFIYHPQLGSLIQTWIYFDAFTGGYGVNVAVGGVGM